MAPAYVGGNILNKSDKEDAPPGGALVQREPEPTEIDKEMEDLAKEVPPEVREFLKGAPPEVRQVAMSMMTRTSMGGSLPHPLFDKFTPQHIDKLLDLNEEDNKRNFNFASRGRWFQLSYVFFALSFVIFLIVYLLPNNKDILNDLLKVLVGLAGGFGLGYGYKSMK